MDKDFDVTKLVNPRLLGLTRTNIGFDRSSYTRLDKNENLNPHSDEFLQSIQKMINSNLISNYGYLDSAYKSIAKRFSCETENIYLTAGADLAIKSIYETFIECGALITIPELAYGMHQVYSQQFGAISTKLEFDSNFNLVMNHLFDAKNKSKIVFLESPLGATGRSLSDEFLVDLAVSLRNQGALLVIDETYAGITKDYISSSLILENPNFLSIRSFSKGFGMAGMRGGLLIGNAKLISWIQKTMPMHEITNLTALMIVEFLANSEVVKLYRDFINHGKSQIEISLDKNNYYLLTGDANFYLIKPKFYSHQNLWEFAKKRGILIRDRYVSGTLTGFFRVTIGSYVQNEEFLKMLDQFKIEA